ncbi:PTS lactose/cellobiose transporter subunit IIA [Streptococcus pluranimalium]|uniref:PTS lactose/cellobiose transporter subunit IIA n=1 Tax=Streptococcus pluranimalium TaxID=82348 RepID=UPI0039FBBF5A
MEQLEQISMTIIAASGTAKSLYIEAIQEAKKGNFEQANQLIEEGHQIFVTGHHAHAQLLQESAEGELPFSLLLLHAEDQMMSSETIKVLAEELIDVYATRKG